MGAGVGVPAPLAHDTAMGLPRLSAALYWCSIHNRLTAAPAARLTSGTLCFTHELRQAPARTKTANVGSKAKGLVTPVPGTVAKSQVPSLPCRTNG